jgi:drug/metabolite transporter (DMT)-like permease
MTGPLWAVTAGLGFGVFQSLNRRAVRGMDVYVSTFIQLLISALVLAGVSLATEDIGLLFSASAAAWLNFALAGFIHFFVGWTLLNASQKKIGAARTSSLIGTTPLMGAVIAAVTLAELPTLISLGGILLIVTGVFLVNRVRSQQQGGEAVSGSTGFRSLLLGLAAALCWSLSPTFIRHGLAELPYPVLGVTVGLSASALGYGVVLVARQARLGNGVFAATPDAWVFKVIAGALVGLSTWMRWQALELAGVAVVLALSLVSVPTVNLLSPLVVGTSVERVTAQMWAGSLLIIGGSLALILLA